MAPLQNYSVPNTLTQQIAEHISSRIIAGEFPQNYQLKVLDLAAEYSASQTVIREALNILSKEFLVEITPRKGAFVKSVNCNEIYVVWEIKKRLWSLTFRVFCEKHSDDQDLMAEFNRILDAMVESGKKRLPEELYKHNFELSSFLIANCGNDQLSMILNSIEMQVKRFRHISIPLDNNMEETARLMSGLQDSTRNNQLDLAEQYVEEFIEMDRRILLNNLNITLA